MGVTSEADEVEILAQRFQRGNVPAVAGRDDHQERLGQDRSGRHLRRHGGLIRGDNEIELPVDHRAEARRLEAGIDRPFGRDIPQSLDDVRADAGGETVQHPDAKERQLRRRPQPDRGLEPGDRVGDGGRIFHQRGPLQRQGRGADGAVEQTDSERRFHRRDDLRDGRLREAQLLGRSDHAPCPRHCHEDFERPDRDAWTEGKPVDAAERRFRDAPAPMFGSIRHSSRSAPPQSRQGECDSWACTTRILSLILSISSKENTAGGPRRPSPGGKACRPGDQQPG